MKNKFYARFPAQYTMISLGSGKGTRMQRDPKLKNKYTKNKKRKNKGNYIIIINSLSKNFQDDYLMFN